MILVEDAGGKCLPCIVDVREESQVIAAVNKAVETFGGIDILVNNASAINLTGTEDLDMKRYDLMQNINTRGTFLVWVAYTHEWYTSTKYASEVKEIVINKTYYSTWRFFFWFNVNFRYKVKRK